MPRKRKVNVTDDEVVAAYAECPSSYKLAERFGLGATTVHRILKNHGVELIGLQLYRGSRKTKADGPYIGVYQGSTEEILKWYQEGASMKEIARRIGRSIHVVARRVRQAGIARPFQAAGPEHSMWQGGTNAAGQGYFRTWVADDDPMASMRTKNGYVLEHRLVLARKVGRPLRDTESVHHIDGNRENNAPENLQLRQGAHGKGTLMCCLDCGSANIGHRKLE